MEATRIVQKIFSSPDVKHGTSLFTDDELKAIEDLVVEKDGKYLIKCQIKDKLKTAKPEEIVRQLWISRLLLEYNYPKDRIDIERIVYFGSRDSGLADIVVLHEDLTHPYIIFEIKRPKRTDGLEQLKSYCNAEGAPIGVWSNGNEMIRLHREEPNLFTEIPRIPMVSETLKDIMTERWTLKWLEDHDELRQGKTTLKKIILDLEELVLGNAGVKPFDEIFKLIYAKLYDEWKGINNSNYRLEFYVGDRSPEQVKKAITNLLDGARRTWSGVFETTDKIELMDTHLKVCASFLEKIKLFNSNLRIIDEAFEYLIPDVAKKKEGQFFTPRPAEDMAVKMLNPKPSEFLIDPACGSAGFLLHSVMWIAGGVITGRELPIPAKNFAQNAIYGIDFAKEAVRIAKAINLIVGDGKSHIYGGTPRGNSLNPLMWDDETKAGLRSRLLRFSEVDKDRENQSKFLYFDFDVLMTNPPFAGTIKERDILRLYRLAEKNGRFVNRTDRHILFLERSLQFIRPNGRMAIVLPQGLLNNTNAEYIRRFVLKEARILAVVGLHVNTFKPHTGTKTSVLFLQKHSEERKREIQEIEAKFDGQWSEFFSQLEEKLGDVTWDEKVAEDDIPDEMRAFVDSYFDLVEEIEDSEESENAQTSPFDELLEEHQELKELLETKRKQATSAEASKEVRTLEARLRKTEHEIMQRTLGGQVWLTLNDEKIKEQFRRFWIETKVMKEMDYPIFFAVNKKPLKDNKGDYKYKRNSGGDLILDQYGHPVFDHDLDEIADEFVKFAKEHDFDFWREI